MLSLRARTAADLDRTAIEVFSRHLGEPDWLTARRLDAWETYQRLPVPSNQEEAWRRTPLRRLDLEGFVPFREEAPVTEPDQLPEPLCPALSAIETGGRPGAALLQYNSTTVYRSVPAHMTAQGVVFTDLHTAAREHPELIQKYLMTDGVTTGENKFTALHSMLWSGGAFLYIPKDVYIAEPVQFALWFDAAGLGIFNHTLIVAEAGARVAFLERLSSADGQPGLQSGVVEIFAAPGSRVTYAALQRWGDQARSLTTRRALVSAGATVDWVTGEFGGSFARVDQESRLLGEEARSASITLFFAGGGQHLDIGTGAVHAAPRTASEILARGVLAGEARAVYRGLGHIHRGARQSRMHQREQSLLLSDQARSDAIPSLLIDDDDVQAGHAAAAGQVDREMLFYLMSRGIPEEQARKIIVHGFFQPLFERIPTGTVRQELQTLIDRKMNA